MANCQWIARVEPTEQEMWGGEVLDLQQAADAGASTLPGFVISAKVYAGIFADKEVKAQVKAIAKPLNIDEPHHFAGAAKDLRKLVNGVQLKAQVKKDLKSYFEELRTLLLQDAKNGLRLTFTSVDRFANGYALSQTIHTVAQFEKAVKQLISLQFTDGDLYERAQRNGGCVLQPFPILVQYMEKPLMSGIAHCHDPQAHDDTVIHIESWHFQHPPKAELVTRDTLRVDRKSLQLLSKDVSRQWWAEDGEGKFVSPLHLGKVEQSLNDEQITQLARVIKQAQSTFIESKKFSWVFGHGQFWISRIQDLDEALQLHSQDQSELKPILVGVPGALGLVSGRVRLIHEKRDWQKLRDGEIAVVEHLRGDEYELLAGAAGVLCESGTKTSIESKVAQQLGIVGVVGAGSALSILKDGQCITLDGVSGNVYAGQIDRPSMQNNNSAVGTKLYATVLDPHTPLWKDVVHADGIGLLRGEFILRLLGIHPQDVIRKNAQKEYVDVLTEGLSKVVNQVSPRPVTYQLHDVSTVDVWGFRSKHHDRYEPNPAMGYRGAHRLLQEPEVLDLELQAIERLVEQGQRNMRLMIPMARSLEEVEQLIDYLEHSPLYKAIRLPIWVKCETPGLLIQMEQLCELPISGVCFSVPQLAQFMSGIDGENYQVAHKVDSTDAALDQGLGYAISVCRGRGIATMIMAEGENLRPEVVQTAVMSGVTSVSVEPEQLVEVKGLLAAVEQRMLLDHLLED